MVLAERPYEDKALPLGIIDKRFLVRELSHRHPPAPGTKLNLTRFTLPPRPISCRERSIWHEQSRRQSVTSSSTTNTIGVACDIADDPESWPTTLAGSMVFACILGRKSAAYCSGHSKSRSDGLT